MGRVCALAIGWLLLAAAPAVAQSNDPFRETAPPQAGAAAPTLPHPRPALGAEPAAPSPQPGLALAPALPAAAQVWARVREVAQGQGIAVPLASSPPFDVAGTPPQYRALLGAWGPGAWQGGTAGSKIILVVQSVDGDGNVKGIIGTNSGGDGWFNFTARFTGDRFTVHFQQSYYKSGYMAGAEVAADNYWPFVFYPDGKLSGSRDNGASSVVLPRLQ